MANESLGAVISEHKGRFAAGGMSWFIGAIIFGCGAYGAGAVLLEATESKVPVMHVLRNIPFFLIVMTASGLWLLNSYTRWRQHLTIYTDGFVWTRVIRKPLVLRWSEIESVRVTRHVGGKNMHFKGTHAVVCLKLVSGKNVTVTNDMTDAEQLASYAGGRRATPAAAASPWGQVTA